MKKIILIILILVVSNILYAKPKDKKLKSVFIKKAEMTDIYDTFIYPVKIVSQRQSYLLAESQGRITKIQRGLGDAVKKNQAIISLRHNDPAYNYRPLKVLSPIDGIVAQIYHEEGTFVSKGEKLGLIIDPTRIKIIAEITSNDLKIIKKGEIGEIKIPGTDILSNAKIIGVSPMIDPMTGTATAWLKPMKKTAFPPGTLGYVTFKTNKHKGILISSDVIVYQGRKTFVRIVNNKEIVKKIEVSFADRSAGMVEITKGPKSGENIVVRSSGFLADGSKVIIKSAGK